MEDPGGDVNLFVTSTLADAIHVVRGDIAPAAAIDTQRLEILGDGWACKGFVKWLNLGPLTAVASQRRDAFGKAG